MSLIKVLPVFLKTDSRFYCSSVFILVFEKIRLKNPRTYLEPCQATMMELLAVNYFRKKAPTQMFSRVLNTFLSTAHIDNTEHALVFRVQSSTLRIFTCSKFGLVYLFTSLNRLVGEASSQGDSKSSQTSNMERFVKIVNSFRS